MGLMEVPQPLSPMATLDDAVAGPANKDIGEEQPSTEPQAAKETLGDMFEQAWKALQYEKYAAWEQARRDSIAFAPATPVAGSTWDCIDAEFHTETWTKIQAEKRSERESNIKELSRVSDNIVHVMSVHEVEVMVKEVLEKIKKERRAEHRRNSRRQKCGAEKALPEVKLEHEQVVILSPTAGG